MTSGAAIVEAEVRELLRRRAIDPAVDPDAASGLVDEVVGDYLDRATTSRLPSIGDVAAVARAVRDAVCGLGPLQALLDDPSIDEYRTFR